MAHTNIKIVGSGPVKELRHHPGKIIEIFAHRVSLISQALEARTSDGIKLNKINLDPKATPLGALQTSDGIIYITQKNEKQQEKDHIISYQAAWISHSKSSSSTNSCSAFLGFRNVASFAFTGKAQPPVIIDAMVSSKNRKNLENKTCLVIEAPKNLAGEAEHLECKYSGLFTYTPTCELNEKPIEIAPRARKTYIERLGDFRFLTCSIPASDVFYYEGRRGFDKLAKVHTKDKDLIRVFELNEKFFDEHIRITREEKSCLPLSEYEFVRERAGYPIYKIRMDLEGKIHNAERHLEL